MLRLALLPLLTGVAFAATLTSIGCVDSSGFESCQQQANDKLSPCIAQAKKDNSQQELLACSCQNYVDSYNCYAASCWNRVWECEYQEYIIDYLINCPIAKLPVPYFPAPNKAPDACSCNVGKVFLAIQDAIQETATCSNNANSDDASSNLQRIQGCDCCEISGALSSLYNICPETDPKLIGLSTVSQLQSQLNTDFASCGSYMDTYDCVKDLGYSLDGVSKYYKPTDRPPSGGTATLSNVAGTVTAPASGTVFSYTNGGDGTVYTVTAAGYAKGSDSGSGFDGSDSGDSQTTGSSDSQTTGSSDSQTTGSSDAAATTESSQGSSTITASPTKTGSKSGAGVATVSLSLAVVAMVASLVACF